MPCRREDTEVLYVRTGSDGVGATAVRTGESVHDTALGRLGHMLHWHSQVPRSIGPVGEIVVMSRLPTIFALISFDFRTFLLSARG